MTDPEQTPNTGSPRGSGSPWGSGSPEEAAGREALPGEFSDVVSLLRQAQPALSTDLGARLATRLAEVVESPTELPYLESGDLKALVARDGDEAWSLAVAIFGEPGGGEIPESPAWQALAQALAGLKGEAGLTSERVLLSVAHAALAVATRRGLEIAPAELLRAEERVGLLLRGGLGLRGEELPGGELGSRLVEAYPQSGSEELRRLIAQKLLAELREDAASRLEELREGGVLAATLIMEHYREVTEVPPRVCVRLDELAAAVESWKSTPDSTEGSAARQGSLPGAGGPGASGRAHEPVSSTEPRPTVPSLTGPSLTGPSHEAGRVGLGRRLFRASRRNVPVLVLSGAMALVLSGAVALIVWKSQAAEARRLVVAGHAEWRSFRDRFQKDLSEAEARLAKGRQHLEDHQNDEALSELTAAEARLAGLTLLEVEFSLHTDPLRLKAYQAEHSAVSEGAWRQVLLERSRALARSGREHHEQALEFVARGLKRHGRAPTRGALARSGQTHVEALASFAEECRELRIQRGRVEALLGRSEAALETFGAVLADHPKALGVYLDLAHVRQQRSEHAEAVTVCNKLLKLDLQGVVVESYRLPASLLRGESYLALGRPSDALLDFQAVLAMDDDCFEGYLAIGRAQLQLRQFGEAQDSLTEAIDILPSLPDGYLERGRLFLAQRRLERARKDFEVAISRSKTCYAAYVELGRACERLLEEGPAEAAFRAVLDSKVIAGQEVRAQAVAALGQLELALSGPLVAGLEFESAHRRAGANQRGVLGPHPSLTRLQAGQQKLVKERLRDARYHLDAAIRVDPKLAAARLGRARLALREGDLATLAVQLSALQEILAARPKLVIPKSTEDDWGDEEPEEPGPRERVLEGECLALLGLQAQARGSLGEAREHLLAALSADPQSALAKAALAGLVSPSDRALAQTLFAEARESQADTSDESGFFYSVGLQHANLARRTKGADHYQRARRAFARARIGNPLHALSYLEEGRLCADWEAWDAALACLKEAIRADPFLWEAHHLRGLLLSRDLPLKRDLLTRRPAQLRDAELGRKSFDQALAIAPKGQTAEAHYGRALASIALAGQGQHGALQSAWGDLEAALAEIPEDLSAADPDVFVQARTYLRAQAQVADALGDSARQRELRTRLVKVEAQAKAILAFEIQAAEDHRDALNYVKAIERYDQAIALDSKSSKAIFGRGTCYLKIGNFVPGILDFSRALEIDPRIADQVYNKVYQISYVVDLNRVITEMNKIVSDHPKVSYVVFLRGFFYVAYTEFKQVTNDILIRGLEDFNRCLELNPKHVTAYLYRGFLYSSLGSRLGEPKLGAAKDEWDLDEDPSVDLLDSRSECFARALEDFERALELDPGSGIAHYLRALHWARRASEPGIGPGKARVRQERALESLRIAFESDFKGYERVRNEKAFDSVRELPEFKELMRGK